jgi:hypothetical protein
MAKQAARGGSSVSGPGRQKWAVTLASSLAAKRMDYNGLAWTLMDRTRGKSRVEGQPWTTLDG